MSPLLIGVLALQGCVERHRPHIEAAGASFAAVKTPEDFKKIDALIIPGGESTTMLKLIDMFDLEEPLKKLFASKPVWGICAGCILIAKEVIDPVQKSFGLLPITVERNGYGRQEDSMQVTLDGYPVSFIRAPKIKAVNCDIEVLARHDGDPVWLRHGRFMATTFHPELTLDYPSPMHVAFMAMVEESMDG